MTIAQGPSRASTADPDPRPNRRPQRRNRGPVAAAARRPVGIFCLLFVVAMVVIAIVAPMAMSDVLNQQAGDLARTNAGPSAAHPLGTDTLGRDVLDRLLVGTRVSLIGIAIAVACALALGVPLGLLAGYTRGWIDRVVGWVADLAFSMPTIIVAFVVLAIFPQSMVAAMVTLGVLLSPSIIRVVRSATIVVREELYVDAAKVAGLSTTYILTRHILPRIVGPVIVQASLVSGVALIVQTALAFLQLVVPTPQPSWGGMIADGLSVLQSNPWLILPPGLTVTVTILVLGLLGDVIRDASTEAWAPPSQLSNRRAPARPIAAHQPENEPDSQSLLSARGLSVELRRDGSAVEVLHDVDLDVPAGQVVAIVGESGCGKSITARSIVGLLPASGELTRGRISFGGADLTAMAPHERHALRGKEIAWVSQEPMISLTPVLRVGWQVAESVRKHQGLSRADARARAVELLGEVGLRNPADVARRYPHELSGGMAQRVAIARALAGDPALLIADEPTTALDVTLQQEILELLRRLQRDRGMALLLVTHDWGVVADIADRVVVMYAGQVIETGLIEPIFEAPRHPYTKALMASDPHHAPAAADLPYIRGAVPRPEEWPRGCHFAQRCDFYTEICASSEVPLVHLSPTRTTRCIHHNELQETS